MWLHSDGIPPAVWSCQTGIEAQALSACDFSLLMCLLRIACECERVCVCAAELLVCAVLPCSGQHKTALV